MAVVKKAASSQSSGNALNGITLDVHYMTPGSEIIMPQQVEKAPYLREAEEEEGMCDIKRILPSMVVKYGKEVFIGEAKALLLLKEQTSVPSPKLYAAYTYGPLDSSDVENLRSAGTYIFMEYIEGETLQKIWSTCEYETKPQITLELKFSMEQLRSIPIPRYTGSVDQGCIQVKLLDRIWLGESVSK